jgi:hypothetical protein
MWNGQTMQSNRRRFQLIINISAKIIRIFFVKILCLTSVSLFVKHHIFDTGKQHRVVFSRRGAGFGWFIRRNTWVTGKG